MDPLWNYLESALLEGHICKKERDNLKIIVLYKEMLEVDFVDLVLLGLKIINFGWSKV